MIKLILVNCGLLQFAMKPIPFFVMWCAHGAMLVFSSTEQNLQHTHGEHVPNEGQNAFLPPDEVRRFDHLPPAESRARLELLVKNKIDVDKDGVVTEDELRDWIAHSQKSYIRDDVERQWKAFGKVNDDGTVTWTEMLKIAYGFDSDEEADNDVHRKTYGNGGMDHKPMVERDRQRFKAADENSDGQLTKQEFSDFLHPENSKRMHTVIVKEALLDLDLNHDGKVDVDEYLHDLYPEMNDRDAELPHWYGAEKDNFARIRDKDGDGFMDEAEISDWLLPTDTDFVTAEAKHLMNQADEDRNGKLTITEILTHHDLFVGSQVTDFGSQLHRAHDEL